MSNKRDSPKRSQHFFIELYPDTTSYNCDEVLANLSNIFTAYAYILHDRDITNDGELKKPHIHVFGSRPNQAEIAPTAKKLGIPEQFVELVKNRKISIRYLLHADNPEKAQYSIDDVVANFDISKWLDIGEIGKVRLLVDEIYRGNTTTYGLVQFALENNCWSELRRSYSIMKDLIAERVLNYD